MPQVVLTINGRNYRVACDEGEEERVLYLGQIVDQTLADLVDRVGQVGEMQLLVMTALMLADEAEEASVALQEATGQAAAPANGRGPGLQAGPSQPGPASDGGERAAEVLEATAARLESLAARLERA